MRSSTTPLSGVRVPTASADKKHLHVCVLRLTCVVRVKGVGVHRQQCYISHTQVWHDGRSLTTSNPEWTL
jgi:hypothetical protein